MPAISIRATGEIRSPHAAAKQIIARGEFVGLARWLTSAPESEASERNFEPNRPHTTGGIDAQGEDPAEANSDLAAPLAAIADDVQGRASAARAGIQAEFAARIDHVRKHVSGFARAAAISALAGARKAALALVNQSAALELAERKRGAIQCHGGRARNAKSARTSENNKPLTDHSPR